MPWRVLRRRRCRYGSPPWRIHHVLHRYVFGCSSLLACPVTLHSAPLQTEQASAAELAEAKVMINEAYSKGMPIPFDRAASAVLLDGSMNAFLKVQPPSLPNSIRHKGGIHEGQQ